ncbi:MAG: (Fe-S)-binding protein [Candidatus Abyssubacteria bacterium]
MSSERDISQKAAEELEKCARCGKCRAVCPVFAELRDEAFVARGRVALFEALSRDEISASPELQTIMSACLMCQRCREICPSGVQFVEILLAARARLAREMGLPFGFSFVFRYLLMRRRLFDFAMRAAAFVQRVIPGRRRGSLRHLPLFFKGGKWLPPLAKRTALERFGVAPLEKGEKKRVGIFVGCLTNYVYPEIVEACIELLRAAGMDVMVPESQLCCGTPALALGDLEAARRLARRNKACFEDARCDYIVAVCASCGRTLKQEYPYLLDSSETLGAPVLDVCEFLVRHTDLAFGALKEKATYHDPCHLRWGQGIAAEPRRLLARSCAFEEIEGDMYCCGQAGTFHVFYPEIAEMLGRRKVESLSTSDASEVATGCPGCILQLNDLMAGAAIDTRAVHTVEILARALKPQASSRHS